MSSDIYRYHFAPAVRLEDVEAALVMAIVSTESLHGEAQVRLDAAHFLDPDQRACILDASTPVGRDFNRLFVGFVSLEFGEDAFSVERINHFLQHHPQEVQT